MSTVGGRTTVRYVVDVRGRIPDRALPSGSIGRGGLHLYSVLSVRLRDDAALYGLLRRIQGLALTLVEMRRLDPGDAGAGACRTSTATSWLPAGPVDAEVVVEGGLGELALESLRDVCLPLSLDSRLVVDDGHAAGDVLSRLAAQGLYILGITSSPPVARTHRDSQA